jgi:RNA polymerase sigma factor for flagellar operon FliA
MAKNLPTGRGSALKPPGKPTETPLVDPRAEWTPGARVPGSAARERLLLAHAPLVKYLAHRIGARLAGPVDFDDLVGDGLIGLIEAVERFDPSHNVLFKTYAETRIRGAILDGVRNRDWAPRSLRRAARRLENAIVAVEQKSQRTAIDEEIARELDITIEELQDLYMQARGVRLSALPAAGEESRDPADPSLDPLNQMEEQERRRLLAEEIDQLPEREKLVLSLYYERGATLKEVGAVLDVTESRACQLHTRALARLRARVRARLTAPVGAR